MRKKCNILSLCSFAAALVIFLIAYLLFHFLSPDGGFTTVCQETAAKPVVTMLVGILGVLFAFTGFLSLLVGKIFFSEK